MFIVTGGRQTGKTDAVCRWLAEAPGSRCVIVANGDRKRYLVDRMRGAYPHMRNRHDWRQNVISIAEIDLRHPTLGIRTLINFPEVAIDDVEDVFRTLFGATLEFATASATWIPLAPTNQTVKADAKVGEPVRELPWDGDFPGNEAGYPANQNPYITGG